MKLLLIYILASIPVYIVIGCALALGSKVDEKAHERWKEENL